MSKRSRERERGKMEFRNSGDYLKSDATRDIESLGGVLKIYPMLDPLKINNNVKGISFDPCPVHTQGTETITLRDGKQILARREGNVLRITKDHFAIMQVTLYNTELEDNPEFRDKVIHNIRFLKTLGYVSDEVETILEKEPVNTSLKLDSFYNF